MPALSGRRSAGAAHDDDIVARVYGSDDFAAAVESFMAKRTPEWHGR